jgi:hypothetical protein
MYLTPHSKNNDFFSDSEWYLLSNFPFFDIINIYV